MRIHPNPMQRLSSAELCARYALAMRYDLLESDGPEWPLGTRPQGLQSLRLMRCGMFLGMSFTAEAGAHSSLQIDLRPAITSFMEAKKRREK